jgi:hypothetical protein
MVYHKEATMPKADKSNDSSEEFQGVLDESGEGFTFDMSSQEEDSGFPVLDAGVYDFSIDSCEYRISQNSGNPMWALRFLVTGPGDDVAGKKVSVRNYQVFTREQIGRVKQFLNRIGKSDIANRKDFNPKAIADDGELIGATGRARLSVRDDDTYGRSNEVRAILPAGGAAGAAGGGGFSM